MSDKVRQQRDKGAAGSSRQKSRADKNIPVAEKGGKPARILHAAEQLFAELGYDGATIRKIALAAKVPIALVSYHFGSKEELYRAIFELRAPALVDQRVMGIEMAQMEPDLDKRLELLVRSLVVPMFKLRASDNSANYSRILAREASDPQALQRHIIEDMYDPIAKLFVNEIAKCLPDRRKADIHWTYHAMIGSVIFIMSDNGRISRLSDGECDPASYMDATSSLVPFIVNGLKGIPPAS